ncbi:MAG TPA: hypothetical protein VGW38_22650, partial [Chloroflexota bacterium]|nr:hypothetical protein [Chloroflexota bacterium]
AYIYSHAAYKRRRLREGLDEGIGTFGPTALTICAAIVEHGPLDRAELVNLTGTGRSAITKATIKLEDAGILVVIDTGLRGAKTYDVAPNYVEVMEEVRPDLSTFGIARNRDGELIGVLERRKRQNAIARLAWAKADPETTEKRLNNLKAAVDELEGPGVSDSIPRWRPFKRSRWDVHEEQEWIDQLKQVAKDLEGVPPEDKARWMELMGYDEREIVLVCSGRILYMKAKDKRPEYRRVPKDQRPKGPPPPSPEMVADFQEWIRTQQAAYAAV